MKKNFAPLVALRKFRPARKTLILAAYFIFIAVTITFVAWRGMSQNGWELNPAGTIGETLPAESETGPAIPPESVEALEEEYMTEQPGMTEEVAAGAPFEAIRWPLEGEILTGHHDVYRINNQLRIHVGVDIAAQPGDLVMAAWPGTVIDVREDSRLGLLLEIDHGNGLISQYANLVDAFFSIDDEVQGGEAIAKVGQSAALDAAEGPFLHFALYRDGIALDPVREISPR